MPFDPAKLAALQARPGVQKAGGARRKQVVEKKNTVVEDKKLTAALARLNCKDIPAIEEVNMYNDNGTVIQFKNPKVKVASGASAYVVSGTSETKNVGDLPLDFNNLGPENLELLKKLYQQTQAQKGAAGEDDLPAVSGSFEDAAAPALE